ncbi:hypothetical protein LSCM1_03672 [Leishmania martiniquensis]|uniref:Leucine-rich repeat protein n=1 Tax=Leishmania martiniquensis TaxID=1580590 RepID=A0A836H8Y9_9TRYP|nr:hypothetical protein LSCM1_03672 [Leishmania martiniquensis]
MCANHSAAVYVPTVYDLMREQQPRHIGTLASKVLEDLFARSAHTAAAHPATSPSSSTRSLADFLDDIFFSYTGVLSWAAFLDIQQEGAALRRQLSDGATFAHEAVRPSLSPILKQWTQSLRAQKAARARAIGAEDAARNTAAAGAAAPRSATSSGKPTFNPQQCVTAKAAAAGTLNDSPAKACYLLAAGAADDLESPSLTMERELAEENACAHLPAEEEGVLPLWEDLKLTRRCDAPALQCLRRAVGAYYAALLRLVDLSESLADHWGLLSPKELKQLHRAMVAEKGAHLPPDFLFSVFTELNATRERLSNAVADLQKCARLEVVRLNGNSALTELNVLPPNCRLVSACGCSLTCFLEPARLPPHAAAPLTTYASVTTLGLAYNQLRHLRFLQYLPSLRILNMAFNYVTNLEAAVQEAAAHGSLAEVTLQGNPISLLDVYRTFMVRGCVHLDRLDGVAVTGEERRMSHPTVGGGGAAKEKMLGRPLLDNSPADAARRSSSALPPNIYGRGRGSTTASPAQPSHQHSSLARDYSTSAASPLSTYSAVHMEASLKAVPNEELRTTVAAGLNLVTVKGLTSLQPVPQPCVADSLLPSSSFVLDLAGGDRLAHASVCSSDRAASPLASPLISTPQASSSRKGRHSGGVAGDSGGKSAPPNANSQNGKRVVTPLYEVSSRVTVEGCWGGSSVSSSNAPLDCAEGVRVAVQVCLEPPATAPAHHGGRHTGAAGAPYHRSSSTALGKQRRAGGAAAAANGAASLPHIPDPYIPSCAAAAAGGDPGATRVASLPLTDTLVYALQQPLVLRVVVQDTFRFAEGEATLRAQLDAVAPSATRGGSASRNGATARSATGELASHGVISHAPLLGEASPSGTSHSRRSEDAEEGEEEEEPVMHLRRELGVITLDPGELLLASGGDPAACMVVPCSSTPLPNCRVLYVHDAALEKDSHAMKIAEREVRQQQRRLRESLTAYLHMHHQYKEATRKGIESPEALSPTPLAALNKGSAATGITSPHSNRQRNSLVGTAPPSLPLSSAPSSRNLTRSRHASVVALPAHPSRLQGLYTSLKAQQLRVAQRALRVLALRARLVELDSASLSVNIRFCIGRGVAPPPLTAADAELDALLCQRAMPVNRKGRQQAAKGNRR